MTRINAGIPPAELPSKLLLAELRELKRIPNNISKGKYTLQNIPDSFKLGPGHVKFFYPRCLYLLKRYSALRAEAIRRGYNVQDFSNCWQNVPESLMNDWNDEAARQYLVQRIESKGFKLI